MKLLLTSGGIENKSMEQALRELMGKPFSKAKLAFIPTASNAEAGDKAWLIKDLVKCQELGFKEIDVVDISAIPKQMWEPRLRNADVFFVEGGYTIHLLEQFRKSGLAEVLPELLKTRIYIGVSAGSMVLAPRVFEKSLNKVYGEPEKDFESDEGVGLVDFLVVPHVNSKHFPNVTFENVEKVALKGDIPFYAIDDQTAVQVLDGKVKVVSEGTWKRFY